MTARDPITTIAPGDTMFQPSNPERYFGMGEAALEGIGRTRAAANARQPARILDLGCGYGRVLRSLAATFPEAELAASDIDAEAVAFCAETFGAEPILGVPDFRDLVGTKRYDVVWSGSLLTHLEWERWEGYFDFLERALVPGGVAVFTTHGRYVADRLRSGKSEYDYGLSQRQRELLLQSYDDAGFGYQDYRPDSGYGISLSRPSWVLKRLEHKSLEVVHLHEQGWGQHQDLIGCLLR